MHKSITLLGREFHFGLGFLNELIDGTGYSLNDFDEQVKNNPAKFLPLMVFHSLKYSYLRGKKEVDFDIHDIYELIDDNGGLGGEFLLSFLNAFTLSMTKDVPVDDTKKKSETKTEIDFKKDVISFACGELGIMRIEDVYDMTFAEFQVRLFAYKRIQLREWEKVRQIAWSATIGSHQDPKTLPKTIEKFMPLGAEKPKEGVSAEVKENFLKVYKEYLTQVQNG